MEQKMKILSTHLLLASLLVAVACKKGASDPVLQDSSIVSDVTLTQPIEINLESDTPEEITISLPANTQKEILSCDVFNLENLTVVSACDCSQKVCSVTVTANDDFAGLGNFDYTVTTADNKTSNVAVVAVPIKTTRNAFISAWIVGDSNYGDGNLSITLPLVKSLYNGGVEEFYDYDFTIDWGDGSEPQKITAWNDPAITHTYPSAGEYQVTIKGKVEAWSFANLGSGIKNKFVEVIDLGDVKWKNLANAFYYCVNLRKFRGGKTHLVTSMNSMFHTTTKLIDIDLTTFNTKKVRNMGSMFHNSVFEFIDLSNFDVQNVTDMSSMFYNNQLIKHIDLSSFNPVSLKNMSRMFMETSTLKEVVFPKFFETTNLTNMRELFRYSGVLNVDLSSFHTSKVTDIMGIFDSAYNLKTVNLEGWDTSNVTDMSRAFNSLWKLESLNISSFNTSKVTNMSSMFAISTPDFQGITFPAVFDTSNVTNMSSMFSGIGNVELPNGFNTAKVTDMSYMFTGMKNDEFIFPALDTSQVVSMGGMFKGFKGRTLDLSNLNTSKVTTMWEFFSGANNLVTLTLPTNFVHPLTTEISSMFLNCRFLTELDLSKFNTINIKSMRSLFQGMKSLKSLDLAALNTSNVTNMQEMFAGVEIPSLDLSKLNTSNVTTMKDMFQSTKIANIDFNALNTTSVKDMSGMFSFTGYDELILTNFVTNNVVTMDSMFRNTTSKKIDISSFNTANVTDMTFMFYMVSDLIQLNIGEFNRSSVTKSSYFWGTKPPQFYCSSPSDVYGFSCVQEPI